MCFFISTVGDQQAVVQIKKIPKIFHFISQKIFKSAEISRVGQVRVNKELLKDDLSLDLKNFMLKVRVRKRDF